MDEQHFLLSLIHILEEKGIAFEDRHIVEANPTAEELKAWHEKSGLPLKRFFNTSGMKYKGELLMHHSGLPAEDGPVKDMDDLIRRMTAGMAVLLLDRKSTRLNSSHSGESRMPSSA